MKPTFPRTFSLRTMLVATTWVCMLLGVIVLEVPRSVSLESTRGVVAGMTKVEVMTRLGRPNGSMTVYGSKEEFLTYRVGVLGQYSFTVTCEKGRVLPLLQSMSPFLEGVLRSQSAFYL